jgi:3-keto-5-aminohexanoate cleavage enzyme
MKPVIVNFCPTGMIPMPSHTQYVPVFPNEIIDQTHEAFELGITIVHLHARGTDAQPSYSKNIYRDIFEGVRKYCPGLIICASTSGRNFPEFEKRSAVIELQPDMCSLTLSSLNFNGQASVNAPDMIIRLAEKMKEYGVKPELECFDLGMINYGKYLSRKQMISPPYYWNLIFGNIAGFQLSPAHVNAALNDLQGNEHFIAFGGIGNSQHPANTLAIETGYGVRTGIEDNIWFDTEKKIKASNIMLLKRVHELIRLNGRELFTSTELGKSGFYNATSFARI